MPQQIGPLLAPIGSFSVLTLPADNSTWYVVLVASSGDRVLKRMRDPDLWTAVLRACPLHAHWLEGEPITEVESMGGVLDRHRRPVANGRPLLTGIALLGDSRACTNPSLGRGISLGLLHARALREVVGSHLEDPQEFAEAWDATTEARLAPWYRETVEEDRERLRELEAFRLGLEPAPPSERPALLRRALTTAAIFDPDLFRAYVDSRAVLKPLEQTFSEDGVAERTLEVAGENQQLQIPGPSREQLVALLG
jgi:flavin-dependent dehydrogenase